MLIRDIMTTKVVTVSSNTSIVQVKKLMLEKKLKRIPVVDNGKLVGLVTVEMIDRVVPQETGGNIWELTYNLGSLFRVPVKRIMKRDVVTAHPEMTVEEALALAQSSKVGTLLVTEGSELKGIVTTNDFFYRIVNKVLGVGKPGHRIWVAEGGEGKAMEEIISTINKLNMKIITLHIIEPPRKKKKDIVVHLDCDDVSPLVDELRKKGHEVELRKR